MFRFPDVFHVGVSVAPVPDQQLYDTIYQERYMGLPQGERRGLPASARRSTSRKGLKGKLLIVHGSGDDNVHYQGTERLVNRLVALGKPFDLMVYPNRTHAISEGPGTTPHVYRLIARYFLENLPRGRALSRGRALRVAGGRVAWRRRGNGSASLTLAREALATLWLGTWGTCSMPPCRA